MKNINVKQQIKSDLEQIISDYDDWEITKRGLIAPEIIRQECDILFLGMNPSFAEGNSFGSIIEWCSSEWEKAEGNYFSKFKEIQDECNVSCAHIDILFFRETNQKLIKSFMKDKRGLDFLAKQIAISKKLIELSKPRMILVANALVKEFLGFNKTIDSGIWMNYDFIKPLDDTIGTSRIITENSNLYYTPVFFTSMLSGRRALDLGTFERLKWHIRFVLEKISN